MLTSLLKAPKPLAHMLFRVCARQGEDFLDVYGLFDQWRYRHEVWEAVKEDACDLGRKPRLRDFLRMHLAEATVINGPRGYAWFALKTAWEIAIYWQSLIRYLEGAPWNAAWNAATTGALAYTWPYGFPQETADLYPIQIPPDTLRSIQDGQHAAQANLDRLNTRA